MLNEKLEELGWEMMGSRAADPEREVEAIEQRLGTRLPEIYRKMLIDYGGYTFLGNGGLFRSEEPTPWDDSNDGTLDINGFYGLGDWHTTLPKMIEALVGVDQMLPDWVIPFGDSSGGNQLCLAIRGDDKGAVYFWDHEYEEGTGLYRTAPSFDAFLEMLQPDPEAHIPIESLLQDKDP